MNNTIKKVLIGVGLIVIVLFVFIVVTSVNNKKQKETEKLNNTLKEVATTFYKDYYYKVVLSSDRNKVVSFKDNGIKLTLNDLAKYKINEEDSILSQFKNYKTNENCDYYNTKVVIYPIEPYGDSDIRVETTVVCGI